QLVSRPKIFEEQFHIQVVLESFQKNFENSLGIVSPFELENQKWLRQKRVFETVVTGPSNIAEPRNPSEEDLKSFEALADTEARLKSYYNRNIARFRTDEQVRARHILVREGSEKNIEDIVLKIKNAELSFEDAAKQFSDDPSNASKGGDLGF